MCFSKVKGMVKSMIDKEQDFQKIKMEIGEMNFEDIDKAGIVFSTEDYSYFYDTCTNKIMRLTSEEKQILNWIVDISRGKNIPGSFDWVNVEDFINGFRAEKLLAKGESRFLDVEDNFLSYQVSNNLKQITLEVTQKCNLRCNYCIYNDYNEDFRNFNISEMSFETAKKALDYAFNHCGEKLAITFYGGEPLLNMDMIKKVVKYAECNKGGKKVIFSLTTNLVLITEEIADYLASIEYFTIMGSMDGPEEIHNLNRRDYQGNGTYQKAIDGLKRLVEALKRYGRNVQDVVSISVVIDKPYDIHKYEKIDIFFKKLSWLPDKIGKSVSYAIYPDSILQLDKNNQNVNADSILKWSLEKNGDKNFYNGTLYTIVLPIHIRKIWEKPQFKYKLNGCCIPGSRKIYVDADGRFRLCERIGCSPIIGNVDCGVDYDQLQKKYIEEFCQKSQDDCSKCWARNLCYVCYAECYDETGLNIMKKRKACNSCRALAYDMLVYYHTILEKNPHIIEELNKIQITY